MSNQQEQDLALYGMPFMTHASRDTTIPPYSNMKAAQVAAQRRGKVKPKRLNKRRNSIGQFDLEEEEAPIDSLAARRQKREEERARTNEIYAQSYMNFYMEQQREKRALAAAARERALNRRELEESKMTREKRKESYRKEIVWLQL